MSYHGVVNIIRTVAQAINPDGFFQHGRTWDASLNFDEGNPQIYLYPLQNSIDESNHYYETWSVVMGFFIQDTQDSSPAQREEIIQNADILQRQFTTALNQIEGIEIRAIRTEPKYRQMAGTYSGVLLNFTLGATTNICGNEAEVVIVEPETLCDKIDTCLNIDRENGNEASFLTNKGTFAEPDIETSWGEITGILADQTDLQTVLNSKSNTGHHHDERYYTETEVDTALSGKANNIHTHNLSDVTGLSSALNAKEDSANKATTMTGNTASNTVYLTAKAVYDWATGLFQTVITAASWGGFINGLTAKTTPVDADMLVLADTADTNTGKKITWASIKSALGINDWVDYAASSTVVGWSSFTTKYIQYRQGYKYAVVEAEISGTSDSTSVSFTIPSAIAAVGSAKVVAAQVQNNGSFATTPGMAYIDPSTSATTIVVRTNFSSGTWTASGTKTIRLTIRCKTA